MRDCHESEGRTVSLSWECAESLFIVPLCDIKIKVVVTLKMVLLCESLISNKVIYLINSQNRMIKICIRLTWWMTRCFPLLENGQGQNLFFVDGLLPAQKRTL